MNETAVTIKAVFDGIASLAPLVTALALLLTSAGAFWVVLSNNRLARRVGAISSDVAEVKANVAIVEKQGNSIRDALVASTAKASHAEGMVAGAEQQAGVDATQAAAVAAARKEG